MPNQTSQTNLTGAIEPNACSRRDFVRGAACGAVVAAAAGAVSVACADEPEPAEDVAWDYEADVVVVGFGGAGAAAAIEADAAGATVCVLEETGRGGGSTMRCGGIIYMGGGTGLQTELGIADTPEDMKAYVTAAAGPSADPDLLAIYCDASLGLYDWCVEQGMEFGGGVDAESHIVEATEGISLHYSGNERADNYAAIAAPAPRGHTPTTAALGIFEPLEAKVESFATVLYNTKGDSLVTDGSGAVVGVNATDADGNPVAVKANKGVVLSTGAFTYNDQMLSDYAPEALLCGSKTGVETDTGDGILMGIKVGAATRSMSRINISEFMYLYGDLAAGVMLDARGHRFLSEDWYGAWIGRLVAQYSPDSCYVFIDQPILDAVKQTAYGAYLEPVAQADSIEELAEAVGLPVQNVLDTMERYAAQCAAGTDADFGKDAAYLQPIETAPFYAMITTPVMGSLHTLGGLKINGNSEVLDLAGSPIPGLYAAGRTSCGIFGEYPGSGSSVADALTFGRIAGASAAAR